MPTIKAMLSDSSKGAAFASAFLEAYLDPAFGAKSKSEVDLLVFSSLIDAGLLNSDSPIYELSRALNITPARVRALLFNWQLRSDVFRDSLKERLVTALQRTRFAKDGTHLSFGIESPILREEVIARLKERGVFPDASFSREIVRMPVEAFVEFLDDLVDDKTKAAFKKTLVKDGLAPDTSFKAITVGVLGKLSEKIIGEAGDAVAKEIVGGAEPLVKMLTSLFTGKGKEAAETVSTIIA